MYIETIVSLKMERIGIKECRVGCNGTEINIVLCCFVHVKTTMKEVDTILQKGREEIEDGFHQFEC